MNKKFIHILLYLALFLSAFQAVLASPNTNVNIIDSILKQGYIQLISYYNIQNQDTLVYMFSDMPFYDYFEKSLIDYVFANNIKLNKLQNNCSNDLHYVKILPFTLDIVYKENLNNYIRTISISIEAVEIHSDGSIQNKFERQYLYSDTLKEVDINSIENDAIPISKGKKESKELNLFDKIIEPVIIVATSALTIILFFTVRSK